MSRGLTSLFAQRYVDDWNAWTLTPPAEKPTQLGIILRRWQACRPNRMRRTMAEDQHPAPYLENLIDQASQHLATLETFEIMEQSSFSIENIEALGNLWNIFKNLSYEGRARGGITGSVGISKAVLLLTDGAVGPAFDSEVRRHLKIGAIKTSGQWISALKIVSQDIREFERNNGATIRNVVPDRYAALNIGRIYDMEPGPRGGVN